MSKKVKVCLALFLSLAVIAQYSFTPQAMVAYGTEEGTVTAAEESDGDSGESSEQKASSSTQETTHATEAPAPTQAPAATTESTQATESTEATTVPEEQSDDVEDENDVNTGDPIAGEDPAAEEEEAAEEDTDEEWERSFSGSCNGLTVKVSAPEGAFKKGTEMNLSAISDATAASIVSSVLPEDKEVADVVGVDISFSYKGSKDQPNESVKVSISGANLEGSNPVLYHKHGGAVEQSGASNNGASVTTGAFSPFVIATSEEANMWTVNFRNRDGELKDSKTVADNTPIGDMPEPEYREDYTASWAIGTYDPSGQGSWSAGDTVNSGTVVTSNLDLVPKYDKIERTVTFYDSKELSTVVASKTVDVDTSYCLNDIPAVPQKTGYTGKWVYGDGKDFNNTVTIEDGMNVWAEYTQNVFTVTFTVDGKEYQKDTYYLGDSLELPSDPVLEGKDFIGWYKDGTEEINGGEEVTSNMTIEGKFTDMLTVRFLVEDGEVINQYFRSEGEAIGAVPQDPFVPGKVFVKWVKKGTETEVTAETVVTESFDAVAVFRTVDVYVLTVEYYYMSDNKEEIIFNTDVIDIDKDTDLPYEITAPSSTQTEEQYVEGSPVYYPETPKITVNESDFMKDDQGRMVYTAGIKYVKYTAVYDFVYLLKDLTGDGYTEIDRESNVQGVLHSVVTPTVKNFDYATLESVEPAEITQKEDQELVVKYTRKNFSLSFETNGGTYVAGQTVPYGSTVDLSEIEDPTKNGYEFDGWYLDKDLTQAAGTTVKVETDTILYAKWKGAPVKYSIVYMFEKYNDAGTETAYVYDNSRDGTANVGSTVSADSAPLITRTGWEVDTEKNAESSTVIEADGSSVLFVYYKLRKYTLTFDLNHNSRNTYMTIGGTTYRGNSSTRYSITVKLGQSIANLWPTLDNATIHRDYYNFTGWDRFATKQLIVNTEILPTSGTNRTFYAQWGGNTRFTINYYLENADDSGYTRSEEYSQTLYNSRDAYFLAKTIQGYTYDHGNSGAWNTTTYNFYYNRDRYQIDYYNGSTKLTSKGNIKFDANINSTTYDWEPTAEQCGVDSDYTFEGWYSDSGLNAKYTFGKMPANNLVLYAKWSAPKFTVSCVDGDNPSMKLADDQTVEKYSKAERPAAPTKEGYTFEGWFDSKDGDDLFDWNTQITEDTVIYAHWSVKPITYKVHYVDADTETTLAPDKEVTNYAYKDGDQITEEALTIAGYRPDESSKSITLRIAGENEITFFYSKKSETTSYKVEYILEGTDIRIHEDKEVTGVDGNTLQVIEFAVAVPQEFYDENPEYAGQEFYPDAAEKTLILTSNEANNVLTFEYSPYKSIEVKVNYFDMDGNPIDGATFDPQILKVGKTFTLSHPPIAEWELDRAVEGKEYNDPEADSSYKITDELITKTGGVLELTLFYKKKVTITANSFSKQYDGTALTMPTELAKQVTVEGLLPDDELTSIGFNYANNDVEAGRLNAGAATVTPKDAVISGHTNKNYYKVRYISGTLEVTKINVTVRIEPDRWVGNSYSGVPYKTGFTNPTKGIADYILISHEGYAAEYLDDIWNIVKAKAIHDESADGLHYYVIAKTDAGDYTYNIDQIVLPEDDNYSVSLYVRPGRLQILPKEVTVTTGSATKTYDGTPLTNADANITGLVASDEGKVTVTATGSQTEVGSSTNSYSINWGEVNSKNYTITDNPGTLTVKPIMTIKVTGNNKTTKYDGKTQTLEGYTVTSDVPGFDKSKVEYSGEAVASGTDAGTYKMGLSAEYFSYNDDGVTASFEVADGILTIAPRDVTVTSASATKVYDGTALTNNGITISGDGFVAGETPAFRVTGSQTAVGSSKNTFDILPNNVQSSSVLDLVTASANGYLASNYNIDKVYGTLTVTQAATPTPTPVPDNDGNNPGGGNPAVAVVNPIPAAIDDTPAPTTINDEPAPRAAAGFWALINLICAILTALLSLIMLIRYFGKRREEDEETGEVTEIKRKGGVKLASIIPAIGAIVAFILTEDMTLPMQMVDKWTVLMVVILAIQALVAFFSRKKEEEEDQEDEGAMA